MVRSRTERGHAARACPRRGLQRDRRDPDGRDL